MSFDVMVALLLRRTSAELELSIEMLKFITLHMKYNTDDHSCKNALSSFNEAIDK